VPEADDPRLVTARAMLGERLRTLRIRGGMRLEDVAAAAGVSVTYLSEIERGRKLPTLLALVDIADAFGLVVTDLLKGVYPLGTRTAPHHNPVVKDGRHAR
jgi:transcriptional regulator with XRE-family HTH domain